MLIYRSGKILVKFSPGTSREQAIQLIRDHGGEILTWEHGFSDRAARAVIRVTPTKEAEMARELLKLTNVAGAWLIGNKQLFQP